jgi:hypothetical protein
LKGSAHLPEVIMKRALLTLAAAIGTAGIASAPGPAWAQTWWTVPIVVDAGTGVLIVGGGVAPGVIVAPTVVAVPVVTTARAVTVGPLLRVSGCYWARERVLGRRIKFRVCG